MTNAGAIQEAGTLAAQYAERLAAPDPALPPGTPRGADELLAAGRFRPGAGMLAEALTRFGTIGLQARRRTVERLVADDGITYGGPRGDQPARPWQVDPLPLVLDADEWARLERGLVQRFRLLDAVLADLVGPRRMLTRGVLPAEVVAAHPGFLPAAHAMPSPRGSMLPLTATDLVRAPDGGWTVIADRTQSPSGAGYAMANRRIIARTVERIHRQANLRRLRGWFDLFAAALLEAAPTGQDDVPRVVLLTAGADSETAFDQGLLSTLLGHPLAEADDLVMRGGRLWLRTMGRLEPVDVVLRRVDAAWTDSLDLLSQSRLGVPGLVAAARRGTVAIVNPLRAAVLENPGLLPFQDGLARELLGEELVLPVPPTWWCGDDPGRSHVLAHLDRLVVKPLHRGPGPSQLPGWLLSAGARATLTARIEAEPWAWTAQEPVPRSTAPVVTSTGLQPRGVVLRTFGVALAGDHHLLPGGLARVASTPETFTVTNASGATSKDVWVLDAEGATRPRVDVSALTRRRGVPAEARTPGLTPRTGSNLYWLGRYAERGEVVARLLLVADNLVEDHHRRPGTTGHAAMRALLEAITEVTTVRPGFTGEGAEGRLAEPLPQLESLLVDERRPGTVAHSVRRAVDTALHVREVLSLDTPSVLSRLLRVLDEVRGEESIPVQLTSGRVLDSLLALSGLAAESLVRDATWAFLDAGRRMERAQSTVRLLRHTLGRVRPPVAEAQVAEAVLRVGDSIITYRRRMAAGTGPRLPATAALAILVLDEGNPRSVLFQLDRLREALGQAPAAALTEQTTALRRRVRGLDLEAITAGDRAALASELDGLEVALRALSDAIETTYFTTQSPQSTFAVAELAGGRP